MMNKKKLCITIVFLTLFLSAGDICFARRIPSYFSLSQILNAAYVRGYLTPEEITALYRRSSGKADLTDMQGEVKLAILLDGRSLPVRVYGGYIDVGQDRFVIQIKGEEETGLYNEIIFQEGNAGKPFVINLRTGGTISMEEKDEKRGTARDGLKSELPYIQVGSTRWDSSQIGGEELLTLVNCVSRVLDLGMVPLITHGTDTMEITAFILSLLFPNRFMVMTGAFDAANTPGGDAPINFRSSQQLAESGNVPAHLYVVMNNKIHLGSRLVKVGTSKEYGFLSYGGHIGEIDENGVIRFNNSFLVEEKSFSSTILDPTKYGISDTVLFYSNAYLPLIAIKTLTTQLITKKESGGRPGLVIEGSLPPGSEPFLDMLFQRGIPVFVEDVNQEITGVFKIPDWLSPLQAWAKLSLLLNQFENEVIPDLMLLDIAGEKVYHDYLWIKKAEEVSRPYSERIPRQKISGNFYSNAGRAVSFVLTFPGSMSKAVLKSEIDRLLATPAQEKILVIEGAGNGNVDLQLNDLLSFALNKGIKVVVIARPVTGRADLSYDVALKLDSRCIHADGLGRDYLLSLLEP
ncbi:MAG: asparaginase domain-containing protein [Candidatus Omnitrophica bacterium]|nr:asparaginase domain-containing protein [Candidatus Omnitrophota bacterium]